MDSVVSIVLFPVALGIVMLGLGLTLTVGDFRRVLAYPKAVVACLVCQMVVLPAVCLGLVTLADLRPELAVGMMLLAASPGGSTASLYSHLFRGNVALNISLTAVNSVLAAFTLPLIVNWSIAAFMGSDTTLGLQFDKVLQVFAMVLVPIGVGMWVRGRFTAFAERMQRPVRILSVAVLVFVLTGAVLGVRDQLGPAIQAVGVTVVAFNLLSLAIGYAAPRLLRVAHRESVASSFEVGVHNATLAITLALSPSLLNNQVIGMPSVIYGSLMFLTAALFGLVAARPARTRALAAARGDAAA
ncbi:bile acid:sodium symporter family protein [Catellatospora sp. KI3]|uniref:bile acid:sodium symporter family protein n=1 Tax=Catellatospora sp. KI3 TaxID=3041620 RepID=UPI0024821AAA|nr:bile acid:sodium symporter family protein [Catellatospora sp. KI3]MDI1461190.1 bile acid:sodium symporter family protein [Catellatospora sp. KI3]